ncbi:DUF308 domain-containing protein [Paraclostridium ghonii]|uniref:Uncharacterized membrane protein HdeD (DUF308 family) n=1 Tax=Paraclostridium ghonii TaxID=29358 RepID=A0ABU0MYW6_9FIRM|nr:DUF308 domain-containing protein [Paeniclostridium ghonii]MDQ0556112.1 uncharacterized membrane protein HdeD (DUF308 family) [Paeniclostridium ghonii]
MNINFNFNNFNQKKNANNFIMSGVLLLIVGTISLLFRNLGIKLLSFGLGAICLFLAYLNLKTINELKRYESKQTIRPYINIQVLLIVVAILFFLFPQKIQGFFSSIFGAYLLVNQIMIFFNSRKNPYLRFNGFNGFLLICGLILILSPLFLSGFIAIFLSLILVLIGFQLLSTGNKLKKL